MKVCDASVKDWEKQPVGPATEVIVAHHFELFFLQEELSLFRATQYSHYPMLPEHVYERGRQPLKHIYLALQWRLQNESWRAP